MRTRISASVEPQYDWTPAPSHSPAANTQATATQAAAGLGRRNICTGFAISLTSGATAPANGLTATVGVLDGASGSGVYLWGPFRLALPAQAGATNGMVRAGLWLRGSINTAMTIEFSAAPGANAFESVVMEGTTEQA
jgi:hypothetical protein